MLALKACPVSEMIRSFIAFDLNNEIVLQRFKEIQESLIRTGADLKLVVPKNIHITIRFLGDIRPAIVDSVHDAMKKVSFVVFNCEICGLGVFPDLSYPRVVWAGIGKGANELSNIFEQLEPNLRLLGFRPDSKGFSPHLTLARVKSGRNKTELVNYIRGLTDYDFGIVTADCLCLKRSILTKTGPIYSILKEVHHQ